MAPNSQMSTTISRLWTNSLTLDLLLVTWMRIVEGQNHGDVRLNDGFSTSGIRTGRLEIYISGRGWGTVCSDSFGAVEANVSCHQLGFTMGGSIRGTVQDLFGFLPSDGADILLDELNCDSSDTRLLQCSHRGIGVHDCDHDDDVALYCPTGAPLRLVSNNVSNSYDFDVNSGHLEIYLNGKWGTVCDDSFGSAEATVACRQLGFDGFTAYGNVGSLGYNSPSSSVPIWLDELGCTLSDTALENCSHRGIGVEDCSHNDDVALVCFKTGSLRLQSSSTRNAGRLEIYLNGQWGTVCDDLFSFSDAEVVCEQLGYSGVTSGGYGNAITLGFSSALSSVPIWLTDLRCTSSDVSLGRCTHSSNTGNTCSHSEDAAVICAGVSNGDIRLNDGFFTSGIRTGRLEIYISGHGWGTVCFDSFGSTETSVSCNQLGFTSAGSVWGSVQGLYGSLPTDGASILLDELNCDSSDTRLLQCSHRGIGVHNCNHDNDVALYCSPGQPLRLASNDVSDSFDFDVNSGRLEIYLNNQWGTVCDDSFGSAEATVACRQLGYNGFIDYGTVGSFGYNPASSSVPTWLDDLGCTSSDTTLEGCSHRGIGVEDCSHSEDVALRCYKTGSLRLQSSSTRNAGRLEIFLNGQWGTVCDDLFTFNDAEVACEQLGYTGVTSGGYGNVFSLGYTSASSSVPIWLTDLRCTSSDTSLVRCTHNSNTRNTCSHLEDAAVRCTTATATTTIPSVVIPTVSSGSSSFNSVGVGTGIGIAIVVIIIVIAVLVVVCAITKRRRHLNLITQQPIPVVTPHTTTAAIMIVKTETTKEQQVNQPVQTHPPQYYAGPQQPPAPYSAYPVAPNPQQPSAPYPAYVGPNPVYGVDPQQPPPAYAAETMAQPQYPYPPQAYPTNPVYDPTGVPYPA